MEVVQRDVLDRVATFYRGRSVLVTGGASFIGSHLVEALVTCGSRVRIADDLSSGRLEHVAAVKDSIEVLIGDLRDNGFAEKACAGNEIVFHLAAAHGGRGYIDTHPVECLNNMVLDHSLLATSVLAGVSKVVFASSACVYPTVLQDSSDDRNLLAEAQAGFDTPGSAFADGEYGWAKLMGELQLRAFNRQYGLDAIACRIFTAYGERENESHAVIALIAKALARLDPLPIWGDGSQTRNFTYVGDTASGLLLAGACMSGFATVNVGSTVHVTINELLEEIFTIIGWRPSAIECQLDMPVGVKSRAANVSKSEERLSWSPQTNLRDGLERTIAWYQSTTDQTRLDALDSVLMSR